MPIETPAFRHDRGVATSEYYISGRNVRTGAKVTSAIETVRSQLPLFADEADEATLVTDVGAGVALATHTGLVLVAHTTSFAAAGSVANKSFTSSASAVPALGIWIETPDTPPHAFWMLHAFSLHRRQS